MAMYAHLQLMTVQPEFHLAVRITNIMSCQRPLYVHDESVKLASVSIVCAEFVITTKEQCQMTCCRCCPARKLNFPPLVISQTLNA
jgi:hypothetical protein